MEVVIFVPGIFGSKLTTPDNEEVWPPTMVEALSGYRRIEKLLASDLRASGVVESICIDVYGSLVKAVKILATVRVTLASNLSNIAMTGGGTLMTSLMSSAKRSRN